MGIGSNKKGPISEINVTPLVDVMLVLLIIFMVTAPMMFNGIKLTLPKTKKVHGLNLSSKQVILSMDLMGKLYLGKIEVSGDELISSILNSFKSTSNQTLYLRADYGIQYGKVAKLMSLLKKNGITQIALVTELEKNVSD